MIMKKEQSERIVCVCVKLTITTSEFIGVSQQTRVKYALLPIRNESTYVLYRRIHLTVLIGQ